MEAIQRLVAICLLAILAEVGGVQGQICAKNWKLHDDTYYIEVSTKMSYDDAEIHCKQMGAELAILKSPDENTFVKDLSCRPALGLFRYWIGMNDLLFENYFQWDDGTQLDPGNERWGPGEPNNRWNQDCVAFITSPDYNQQGKWSTEVCSSNLFSLCSKPLVLPELSNPPDVHDIGTDSFRLSWRCWNEAEDKGAGPVLSYHVHVNTIQDPTVANWSTAGFVLGGDPCELVIEHLHINTEYYTAVSILHGDSRREGPLGPILRVSTHDVDLPVLLEPPEAIAVGTSYVVITWTGWTGKKGEGDGPIAGYNVHIIDGIVPRKLASVVACDSNPEFNVTGLQADTAYQIMIKVIYQDGREGPPGPILTVSTTTTTTTTTTTATKATTTTTKATTTTTYDPGPDIIHPVKPCEKVPCETRLLSFFEITLAFGAGVAFMMLLSFWRRRGNVLTKYVKDDTSPISPERHDRPTSPDNQPPSYHEALPSVMSAPCANSRPDAPLEPRSKCTNYVCLSSKPMGLIT